MLKRTVIKMSFHCLNVLPEPVGLYPGLASLSTGLVVFLFFFLTCVAHFHAHFEFCLFLFSSTFKAAFFAIIICIRGYTSPGSRRSNFSGKKTIHLLESTGNMTTVECWPFWTCFMCLSSVQCFSQSVNLKRVNNLSWKQSLGSIKIKLIVSCGD